MCHSDHGCAFTAHALLVLARVGGSTAHVCIPCEAAAAATFSTGPYRVGYRTMMTRGYRPLWAGETLSTVVFCAVPPKIVVFSSTCFVRDSSSRVSYHVVWDIMSCGIPYHAYHATRRPVPCGTPCHASHHAAWDTVPCATPCLVACYAMSCLVTCHAKRDTMLCRMPVSGISYRAGYAPCRA